MKEVKETTCPFCLLGCKLGIVVNGVDIRGVEYLKDSEVNEGRLCSRGNASPIYLDSPRRLTSPLRDGREVSWESALGQVVEALKGRRREEVALTFDTNLTEEEFSLVWELGEALGVENIASSYLEPEFYFNYSLPGVSRASLGDIKKAKVLLLVGDLFHQVPVISKPILDARYSDRDNRIFVIDSVNSHTAGFADTFVQVKPGKEPLALLAMSKILSDEPMEEVAQAAGVSPSVLEEVVDALNKAKSGVVVAAMAWGKTGDPLLFSGACQHLVSILKGDKKFLPLGESLSKPGKAEFGTLLEGIRAGEIKVLVNFGDLFPYYYPQLRSDLKNLELLVSMTSLRQDFHDLSAIILPAALNMEKSGTINTVSGPAKIEAAVEPMSGTRAAKDILEAIAQGLSLRLRGERVQFPQPKLDPGGISKRAQALLKEKPTKTLLIGEKPAHDFRLFFNKEVVLKVNPTDAKRLGIREKERVTLKTSEGQAGFKVTITGRVPSGICSLPVEAPEARVPFRILMDKETGACWFPPEEVELCKGE